MSPPTSINTTLDEDPKTSLCPQRVAHEHSSTSRTTTSLHPSSRRSTVGESRLEDFIDHSLLRQDDGRTARLQRHRYVRILVNDALQTPRRANVPRCGSELGGRERSTLPLAFLPGVAPMVGSRKRVEQVRLGGSPALASRVISAVIATCKTAMSPRSNSKYTSSPQQRVGSHVRLNSMASWLSKRRLRRARDRSGKIGSA